MFDDGKFHVIPAVRSLRYFTEALSTEEEWVLTSNCAHIGNLQSLSQKEECGCFSSSASYGCHTGRTVDCNFL